MKNCVSSRKRSNTQGNYERRRSYSSTKVPGFSNPIQRISAHEYENIIRKLLEKIDLLENKLKFDGLNRIRIVSGYKDIYDENLMLKSEIESAEKEAKNLTSKITQDSKRIENLTKTYTDFKSNYQNRIDLTMREINIKKDAIEDLNKTIQNKNDKLKEMRVNFNLTKKQLDIQKNELELAKLENESKKEKIKELENEINNLYINKKNESNLLMENKHLKDDNVRLLELLKTTVEYKDFAYLNETLPGGIRYTNESNLPIGPKARKQAIKARLKNLDLWVPALAYDKVMAFKIKYDFNMSDAIISELLDGLNSVYREKEEKNIERIKARYQKQIVNLMTKYGIKNIDAPYNVSEVEEIKKFAEKKDNEEIKLNKMNRKIELEGAEIVNFAKTAAANFFNKERKDLEDQIETLKYKLTLRSQEFNNLTKMNNIDLNDSKTPENKGGNRKIFNEKIINELNFFEKKLNELYLELTRRNKDSEVNLDEKNIKENTSLVKLMQNNVKWFMESLKKILSERKGIFNNIKFNQLTS